MGEVHISDEQLRTNSSNPNVGKQGNTRSKNNWNGGYHNGVDIAAPKGTKLVAPISGTVRTNSEKNIPKGGNVLFITRTEGDKTTVVGLAHLDSVNVKTGDVVQEGDDIGTSGTTGNASGLPKDEQHVHMTVRVNGKITDPQKHFEENPSRIAE